MSGFVKRYVAWRTARLRLSPFSQRLHAGVPFGAWLVKKRIPSGPSYRTAARRENGFTDVVGPVAVGIGELQGPHVLHENIAGIEPPRRGSGDIH